MEEPVGEGRPSARPVARETEEAAGNRDRILRNLRDRFPGIVHLPGSPTYDTGRRVYFTGVDRRPSVVLRPRSAEEVAGVVLTVAGEGGRLAVKGGGHGFTSRGVQDGVPVLDLSALGQISVEGPGLARAGGGATTGAVTRAVGAHGMAVGFGDSPKVGVGGITQAGGVGFLHRRLGLSADQLTGAQVVTADGRVREVDGERDPDLFWALRGGGGGFGVVTRLDYRLAPVDRVVGGMLLASAAPGTVHRALECLHEAPPEVAGVLQVMRVPPMPMVPEVLHGSLALAAFLVHSGPLAEGERWVGEFRRLVPPVMDSLEAMPYPALFDDHGGPADPPRLRWRSAFRQPLSLGEVEALFPFLEEPHDGVMRTVQFRPMGGAVAGVPPGATAFAHRAAPLLASAGAVFTEEEEAEPHAHWVGTVHRLLAEGRSRGAYAGFLGEGDPEGPDSAWPERHRARLLAVKERYDPQGVFEVPVTPTG